MCAKSILHSQLPEEMQEHFTADQFYAMSPGGDFGTWFAVCVTDKDKDLLVRAGMVSKEWADNVMWEREEFQPVEDRAYMKLQRNHEAEQLRLEKEKEDYIRFMTTAGCVHLSHVSLSPLSLSEFMTSRRWSALTHRTPLLESALPTLPGRAPPVHDRPVVYAGPAPPPLWSDPEEPEPDDAPFFTHEDYLKHSPLEAFNRLALAAAARCHG